MPTRVYKHVNKKKLIVKPNIFLTVRYIVLKIMNIPNNFFTKRRGLTNLHTPKIVKMVVNVVKLCKPAILKITRSKPGKTVTNPI